MSNSRITNTTEYEKELILDLVQENFDVVENKKTDGVTLKLVPHDSTFICALRMQVVES